VKDDRGWKVSFQAAFGAFILSRIIVWSLFLLCAAAELIPAAGWLRAENSLVIRLDRPGVSQNLSQLLSSGDAHNYLGIARDGYDPSGADPKGMRNWVFFPLYPLAMRAIGLLSGHYLFSALMLSHLFFFLGLSVLHRLLLVRTDDETLASRAVYFLAINPMAYFFSLPMTESLFLLLFTSAMLSAERAKPIVAGTLMALTTACRPTGLLLLPAFGLSISRMQGAKYALLSTALGTLGVVAYAYFLNERAGDPFAFIVNQAQWNRSGSLRNLFDSFDPFVVSTGWNIIWLNVLGLIGGALTIIWSVRAGRYADALSIGVPIAALLATGTVLSAYRVLMPLFPVWFGVSVFASTEQRRVAVTVIFAVMLALLTACYALGVNSALI